jgi:hypothetical protein
VFWWKLSKKKNKTLQEKFDLTKMKGAPPMKERDVNNRRTFLKTGGAALVAASASSLAMAAHDDADKAIYLHGMAWNRDLPGLFGEVLLTFDLKVQLGKTGFGTFSDAVHPEINSHFSINSITKHEDVYKLSGEIIASRDPASIGVPLTIVAQTDGEKTTATITMGSYTFRGAGLLVVIAIIAILIA